MHENHRQRMRTRALSEGLSGFHDHELLEMLLYYAIPRIDTNETAHQMLEHFGSIKNIMEANADDFTDISGVGQSSALLFQLMIETCRRYLLDVYNVKGKRYTSLSSVASFFIPRFLGAEREELHVMLFNNRMNLISYQVVSQGAVNTTLVPMRYIVEKAYRKNASCAILAHNHPNGIAIPSQDDINITKEMVRMFDMMGIVLREHLVIAGLHFYPIIRKHSKDFDKRAEYTCVENEFYDLNSEAGEIELPKFILQ